MNKLKEFWALRKEGYVRMAKRLLTNPLSLAGLVLLLGFIFIAICAPWIAPPPPNHRNPYMIPRDGFWETPKPPSPQHPFGTTSGQYDIFYGVIWGTRTAFRVGLTVVFSIVTIGIVLGLAAGYFGGIVDNIIMRLVDLMFSFPGLLFAIVITAILGKGLNSVVIAFIIVGWPFYARLMRGEVLHIRESDYIAAARAVGAGPLRIMFRHILPNAIFVIFAVATLDIGSQMVGVAALSFLGLGSPVGYADWGQMIAFSRPWIVGSASNPTQFWYTLIYPGGAIVLFVLAFALLGDAFRDILDPRMRGSR